jgi:hypothetical protein
MDLTADARTHLRVYLNDHRAGAAGGQALAKRCLRNNPRSELGDTLRQLLPDLESEAKTLEGIIERLDATANRAKQVLAVAGERAARLKLNGSFRRYSPLSRLLELEALLAGIEAKRSMWLAFASSAVSEAVADVDFEALATRATEQRSRLQPHHRDAARVAFGVATGATLTFVDERVVDSKHSEPLA